MTKTERSGLYAVLKEKFMLPLTHEGISHVVVTLCSNYTVVCEAWPDTIQGKDHVSAHCMMGP